MLLRALAEALREPAARDNIFKVNAEDLARAKSEGVASPLVKRLGLDAAKLDSVCDGLEQLAAMPDLVGQVTLRRELDDGLVLERVSCRWGSWAWCSSRAPTRWCRSWGWPGKAATRSS